MRFLAHIFVLTCFFPFIDLIRIGTDTQPNAMIVGFAIIFLAQRPRLNLPIIALWVTFFISLLFVFTSQLDTFLTAKIVLNYLCPPVIAMAAYIVFVELKFKVKFSYFLSIVAVYGLVAIVQTYFIHDFMTLFLNEGRGILVGGRGVVSLTTEPAFYGSHCLFLIVFSILNYTKKQNLVAGILLLLQMILLAKSSIGIAILGGAMLIFGFVMLLRLKVFYVLFFVMAFSLTALMQNQLLKLLEGSRSGKIIENLIKDPLLIAQVDGSIAMRVSNSFAPYFVLRHNYFLPMGYGRFLTFLKKLSGEGRYKKIITKETLNQRERIVGALNMVLFQLGFLGLIMPIGIYLAFKRLLYDNIAIFALILFYTLLFTQIQLMYSMIGLIIASAIYQSHLLKEKNKYLAISKTN